MTLMGSICFPAHEEMWKDEWKIREIQQKDVKRGEKTSNQTTYPTNKQKNQKGSEIWKAPNVVLLET